VTGKRALRRAFLALLVLFFIAVLIAALIPLPGPVGHNADMVSCTLADRNGRTLRVMLSGEDSTSCWVGLSQISGYLVKATITAEDKRFYRHHGIDYAGLGRALLQNVEARRIVAGGSTITSQLAEQIFHLPKGRWGTKILQMIYASKIEKRLTKNEILELYLNRIPYGNQIYGIEAAAQSYFDRPATSLSLAQSAFLAAIPQAPALYEPYGNFERTKSRQREILQKMHREGQIDESAYRNALLEPISLAPRSEKFNAPHFCDMLSAMLRARKIVNASYIRTTIDLDLQREAEALLKERVRALKENGVSNGAIIVMDNITGEIPVMVGSVDFWGADGQFNAALARRQPGSTLKPFTYALALENGFTAADIIPDLKIGVPSENGDFTPQNYDRSFHGPVRFRQALACSYNVPAVRVLQKIGPELLLLRLREAGFESLNRSVDFYGVGLTLGSGEVTLLELVRAYSSFSRGGKLPKERYICEARDFQGNGIALEEESIQKNLFSPQVAYIITDILKDREARIPSFGEYSPLDFPFPCAAKTGTSKGFRDNWTIGYTPRYTVGVWVGNFDATAMRKVSGITGAGPLFHDVMRLLHKKKSRIDFARPDGILDERICPASGALPGKYCMNSMEEIFLPGSVPRLTCEVHRLAKIDTRNGETASTRCPDQFTSTRVFEVYPPLYAEWMEQHHVKVPEKSVMAGTVGHRKHKVESPMVIFPKEGDVFRVDPVLRRQYQVIHFKALVPEEAREVCWWIDGKYAGTAKSPFIREWVLQNGVHSVQTSLGSDTYSEKIQFYVH
jgi:penicillin-binding protein 1C